MRVALADDSTLFRVGLERVLSDLGITVVGSVADGPALLAVIQETQTDIAVIDIRMPPTFTDEGLLTAEAIRRAHPDTAILLLSTYAESSSAARLLEIGRDRVGYLVKDRVDDPRALLMTMHRLQVGECVIDPGLVTELVQARQVDAEMSRLTPREQRVLGLIAEGRSNTGIGAEMFLSIKTVETHVTAIFTKLGLPVESNQNRRVLAALSWLRSRGGGSGFS
jgi:DNA-binding NarL/FixJ family response regulator